MNKKIIIGFLTLITITFLAYKFILPNDFLNQLSINSIAKEKESSTKKDDKKLSKLAFLIFKKEQQLEVWGEQNDSFSILHSFSLQQNINAEIGPKLYQNDNQFPEGIYTISSPVSLTLDEHLAFIFPNDFDIIKAKADNRTALDSTLFPIKIVTFSPTLKEINNLLQQVNNDEIQVLIFPNDARKTGNFNACMDCPFWISELYGNLKLHLNQFSLPVISQ